MATFSPELIEQTIRLFKNKSGKELSREEARQALENVCGFFQALSDWSDNENSGTTS